MKQKDRILDGLRTELEELRGPLPSNYAAENDDTMSLASEVGIYITEQERRQYNKRRDSNVKSLAPSAIMGSFIGPYDKT